MPLDTQAWNFPRNLDGSVLPKGSQVTDPDGKIWEQILDNGDEAWIVVDNGAASEMSTNENVMLKSGGTFTGPIFFQDANHANGVNPFRIGMFGWDGALAIAVYNGEGVWQKTIAFLDLETGALVDSASGSHYALKSWVQSTLSTGIGAISEQHRIAIETLTNLLSGKASSEALAALAQVVTGKASTEALVALQALVSGLTVSLNAKADDTATTQALNGKVNLNGDNLHSLPPWSMVRRYPGNHSEGGELMLERPGSGTTLAGNVAIDVSGDLLRIFEYGGAYRGAFINLNACLSGGNTNLLAPTSQGVSDVRIGAGVSVGLDPTGYYVTAPAGHVLTGITRGTNENGGASYVAGGTARPIQKFVNGAWITVAQL